MSLVPDTSMYTFCADPVGPYFAAERAAAQRGGRARVAAAALAPPRRLEGDGARPAGRG